MKKIFKCTECGKTFTLDDCELPEPRTINDGTEHERIVCDSCFESMWDNGDIVNCISCGGWFEPSVAPSYAEEIGDDIFTQCPNCSKDMIDGRTREEFLEDVERYPSYAVTMLYNDGDNSTYLFPTAEKRSEFIDQQLKNFKRESGYVGSASLYGDEILVVMEDYYKRKYRIRIISSNVYR